GKPALSTASHDELVKTLSNPNGWWRDTAQRLLVERSATDEAGALKTLATSATSAWTTKLHALWTLDGIDAIDEPTVQKALADPKGSGRGAAVRISERWMTEPGAALWVAVLKHVSDPAWNVRRQVAASIGALPAAARVDPAVSVLTKYGNDPIIVDA